MKLLLIISQFSPAQTPNTMRWIPLLRFFQDQGHDVYVLTTKRSGQPLESVEDNMAIFRAGYNTLLDFCFDLTKRSNRRNETGNKGYSGTPGLGSVLLEKLVSKTWRKNYWPDGSKLFLKPGIKKGLEIVEDKQISHIISVGLPFTAHLIAQKLKEKNAAINWHMDIQDPFCYSKEFWVNNFKKYSAKNIAAEKAAFHLADSISNTNATADQKYKILFPEAKDKMTIIPPLFALPKSKDNKGLYLFDEKIHLGYFGSFYDGVRSPKPFLDFLLDLHKVDPTLFDKIQIHFFGQQNRFSAPLFSAYPTIRRYFILHGYSNDVIAIEY